MATVGGTSQISAGFNQTVSSGVVSAQTIPASIALTTQYQNGTSAGKIDLVYAKQLTLAATPTTLDLTSLNDLSGASVNFARVRELVIEIVDTTAGHDVTIGDAASNAWAPFLGATGTYVIFAGTIYHVADPNTVGSGVGAVVTGSSKALKLDPGSNTVVVNILIAGCSAVS